MLATKTSELLGNLNTLIGDLENQLKSYQKLEESLSNKYYLFSEEKYNLISSKVSAIIRDIKIILYASQSLLNKSFRQRLSDDSRKLSDDYLTITSDYFGRKNKWAEEINAIRNILESLCSAPRSIKI